MATFGAWIRRTVQQAIDPDREQRIAEVTTLLLQAIQKGRDKFSMAAFEDCVNCSQQDIEIAKRKVYGVLLDRAWRDGKVAADERRVLGWAKTRLGIPQIEADGIENQLARDRFAIALGRAMDDGVIEAHEADQLSDIALSIGIPLNQFVSQYFLSEGEGFLRGVFAACTQDGMLADDAWARLQKTTERLGLSQAALFSAILPQAKKFIEHVLADAKSDGEFSEAEESQLLSLIETLGIPSHSRDYFYRTFSALRTIRQTKVGKLPVVEPPQGIALRAGEIAHLHEPAVWNQRRILKSGEVWDKHAGTVTITDNRILFCSDTRSFDVRFSKIARHSGYIGLIRIQRTEKPESVIVLSENEPVAYAIFEGAIALASQTRLAIQDGVPSRHIPRDVRQRVWQRYGGQCAECGDVQYLEFDHVIPVAKGGSNSDANVQLLCRGCNLKKSDRI